VASGLFDGAWQADDRLVVAGDPALRAQAGPLAPPRPVAISREAMDALTGEYQIPNGPRIRVSREGDRLLGAQGSEGGGELLPESETVVVVVAQPIRLLFQKGPDGKATGMTVRLNGQEIPAARVE
jgi:hypothetical protein